MVDGAGDLINGTRDVKTIIDEDHIKGYDLDELKKNNFDVQSA